MHKKIINFLLFILFLYPQTQKAQSFDLLNVEQGLSNNIVYDIIKDSKGYIWFATENGLNKFDGYSFKRYYHNASNKTSIASNTPRTFLKDKKGNLWIGTKNGLSLYHEEEDSFINYSHSEFQLDLREIKLGEKGKIWFNSFGKAGWFDVNTLQFNFLDHQSDNFCMTANKNKVWTLSED